MPVEEEESSDCSSYSEEEEGEATAVTSPTPTRPIAPRSGQTTAAVPPAALGSSSSSPSLDSEEESDDEDEDSEDEDDEPEPVKSQPATPIGSQKALQSRAPSLGPLLAKSLNSKPMDSKTVKPCEPAPPAKPKRPADNSKEDESRKNKKKKKKKEEEAEAEDLAADVEAKKEDKSDGSKTPQDPKKLFQRVWDTEDEINLLTILFDYKQGGGSANDLNGFFEFSRNDLEKFKKTQLVDKVRKLKKKYENIVARAKNSGKTAAFKLPHEMEAFSLSQLIWGEKGKDTPPHKEANEASGQKSPRKDGGTAVKKSKNNDGREKQLNNNGTNVSERKQEEPDSSVSKGENHVRFFENMEIGVGRTKEDGLGSTVVNMDELVDKWIQLAEQSKVKDLQERQRKLEGRSLEIHSEHLEIASARAKLALEAFKTAEAGRSRQ